MVTSKLEIYYRIKHPRLLFWINAPLVILGFEPLCPKFCIEMIGLKP